MNIFADNLMYLRKQKRLTQEQAAEGISVKVKRYQAWEEGRALPRQGIMPKICDFFQFYDMYKLFHTRIEPSQKVVIKA